MRDKHARVTLVTGQPVSLAQGLEVLMTIHLPDDLFVNRDLDVEIVELAPVLQRDAFAADWFEVPVDRIAETQILEAEQIEFARDDAIGFLDQPLRALGPTRFERARGLFG